MNCEQMREHLLDLAAGSKPEAETDQHLRACAACASQLQEMRQTMSLLDEWQAPEPSPYFDVRLRARMREAAARPRGWLAWLRKPALAVAMAVLMVAGISLFRSARPLGNSPAAITSGEVKMAAQTGSAVADLQDLDKNHDLFANFDVLDELEPQNVNP
jgi:predicted anti-sigma-YlaC factor YlaD